MRVFITYHDRWKPSYAIRIVKCIFKSQKGRFNLNLFNENLPQVHNEKSKERMNDGKSDIRRLSY